MIKRKFLHFSFLENLQMVKREAYILFGQQGNEFDWDSIMYDIYVETGSYNIVGINRDLLKEIISENMKPVTNSIMEV